MKISKWCLVSWSSTSKPRKFSCKWDWKVSLLRQTRGNCEVSGVRFIIDSFWAAKARGALEMRFWEMGVFFVWVVLGWKQVVWLGGFLWAFSSNSNESWALYQQESSKCLLGRVTEEGCTESLKYTKTKVIEIKAKREWIDTENYWEKRSRCLRKAAKGDQKSKEFVFIC